MDDKNEVKDGGRVLLCFFFFFLTQWKGVGLAEGKEWN